MKSTNHRSPESKMSVPFLPLLIMIAGYFTPLVANFDQYDIFNPPNSASWLGSLLMLVVGIVFLVYNKRYAWLCLPSAKVFVAMLGVVLGLSLLTCPFSCSEPELIFHSTTLLFCIAAVAWLLLRNFYYVILLPLLYFGMIEVGAYIQYHTIFNSMVLVEAMECSREEFMVYITPTNISLLVAGLLVLTAVLYVLSRVFRSAGPRPLIGSSLCLLACMYILYPFVPNHSTSLSHISINGTFKRLSRGLRDLKRSDATVNILKELPSSASKPSELPYLNGDEGCIVVFHIGESIRADRVSFNGYERNTTPNIAAAPGLISWKRCIASTPLTVNSLSTVLTDARRWDDNMGAIPEEMRPTCGSVLELFKANGFDVRCYFGAMKSRSVRGDGVLMQLASAAVDYYYTEDDVMETPALIRKQLQAQAADKCNKFILINNEGSHTPFNMYDQDNPPFTPSMHILNPSSSYADAVRNAYDNTIHYTDLFVQRVMDELKGRPFVYVYVSDHGEYLGDYDGTWGRARTGVEKGFFHSTQAAAVAAFVIYSPEFKALHPKLAEAAEQLKKSSNMTIAHEHFFHTLLGIVGIKSPYYKSQLDLCSPDAQPYDGPMPNDWPDYMLEK
ncbi:MAG: sulfatase-like hydrolase/transferase [Akkermansia sp.]|nr:sulfatase-like hydrolase/transferase [Akkermansia sp.]